MAKLSGTGIAIAAVLASAAVFYRSGLAEPILSLKISREIASPAAAAAERKVLYWKAPGGEPDFSAVPKKSPDGRDYQPVYEDQESDFQRPKTPPPTGSGKVRFYRNPMGLPDTSPTPKKDSMGMDYIPVFEGDGEDGNTIKLSPAKIQRAGVETVAARRATSTRAIKAPGVVQFDERRISIISPRFDGFVERMEPVTTGQRVGKGDPLVTVFGQELLSQGSRLIIEQGPGYKGDEKFDLRTFKGESGTAIGASRRLQNMGVPNEFIEQIKRERRVPNTLTIRAPMDGVVLERNLVEGQAFKAGDAVFKIADNSVVWINADVPESDLAALRKGQKVRVTTRAHPGRTFSGEVSLIIPYLMKETRTARVRIELANSDFALLPDMYTEVEIATGGGEAVLVVPASAVIDSGNRQVVLLNSGDGRYEPRDVKAGRSGDGMVEIISGIAEGDKVVVNGLFLIDSESNLQSALKGLTGVPGTETAR
jgi:membrane fusion protein, copper/silver efflux system